MFKKRIVAIHSVLESTFTPKHLEDYIQRMKILGYKFVGLDEILSSECRGKKLSLTIDDGYKSCITNLLPILKKYNIEATIFISPALLSLPSDSKLLESSSCYQEATMTKEDIEYWLAEGHKIGFHTNSHINLYESTIEKAIEDFEEGIKFFRDNKIDINYFAYPFGFLPKNKTIYEAELLKHGIKNAFTIMWGDVNLKNPYYINRVCLGDNEPTWFSILKSIGLVDFHYYKKQYKLYGERVRHN